MKLVWLHNLKEAANFQVPVISSFYPNGFQNFECLKKTSADVVCESTEDKMTIRCLIYD